MTGFIDIAADFYAHFPSGIPMNDRRKQILEYAEKTLRNSLFLPDGQKGKMAKTLSFLSTQTVTALQQTLIRENLRYLIRKTQ